MELTKTDPNGRALGYVKEATVIDFQIGEDEEKDINDFEIELKRWNWDGTIQYGSRVFVEGTEFGGIVKEISTDTSAQTITAKGYTWRGVQYLSN